MDYFNGSLGVVRKLDSLGRVVIPKEVRKEYGLHPGVAVEISAKNGVVGIKKYVRPENKTVTKKQVEETLGAMKDVDRRVVDAMLGLFE